MRARSMGLTSKDEDFIFAGNDEYEFLLVLVRLIDAHGKCFCYLRKTLSVVHYTDEGAAQRIQGLVSCKLKGAQPGHVDDRNYMVLLE